MVLALAACATPAPPPAEPPPSPPPLPAVEFSPAPPKIVLIDPFVGEADDLEPLPPAFGDLWDRIVKGYAMPDV